MTQSGERLTEKIKSVVAQRVGLAVFVGIMTLAIGDQPSIPRTASATETSVPTVVSPLSALGLPVEKTPDGLRVREFAHYDHNLPWQTRAGAVFCPSYFQRKDAYAAQAAGDVAWFQRTGCIMAKSGKRVVLIDAQHSYGGSVRDIPTWRGRIYSDGQSEGIEMYFTEFDVVTYAVPTIPLKLLNTNMVMSGDKQIEFKTTAAAERWYAQNVSSTEKPDVPHSVVPTDGAAFRLLLGPALYWRLGLLCRYGEPSCRVVGQLP